MRLMWVATAPPCTFSTWEARTCYGYSTAHPLPFPSSQHWEMWFSLQALDRSEPHFYFVLHSQAGSTIQALKHTWGLRASPASPQFYICLQCYVNVDDLWFSELKFWSHKINVSIPMPNCRLDTWTTPIGSEEKKNLLFEVEILPRVTYSRRAHKSRPASSCAPPPRPSWPRPPPWWPPPTTSSLPAGLFVTKVLPIPHNQEQALITIVPRAELGKGTYVEALPFVFRGASSRWGERGATALLSGARCNGDAVPVAEELRGRNSCDSKSHCFPTPSLLFWISSLGDDDDTLCCWGFGGRSVLVLPHVWSIALWLITSCCKRMASISLWTRRAVLPCRYLWS